MMQNIQRRVQSIKQKKSTVSTNVPFNQLDVKKFLYLLDLHTEVVAHKGVFVGQFVNHLGSVG